MNDIKNRLLMTVKPYGKAAVAFSGGVDSTLLLRAAVEALGVDQVVAITVNSPYIPNWEIEEAMQLSQSIGVRHEFITLGIPETIRNNPIDRCYLCKTIVFSEILKLAEALGFPVVFDGTNVDDLQDYRPGLRALAELGVASPLKDAGLTKSNVRALSADYGLPTWDKPAYACLLTRIPYDQAITEGLLQKIEASENALLDMGFRAIRVRAHGDVARIEIGHEELMKCFDLRVLATMDEKIKAAGFKHVTIDVAGYRTGSFNPSKNED